MKSDYPGGVDVIFKAGEYRINEQVAFDATDSGESSDALITYKAYPGEEVNFKGSYELTAQAQAASNTRIKSGMVENILCYDLNQAGLTDAIRTPTDFNGGNYIKGEKTLAKGEMNGVYVNGAAQTLARWPNGDAYATMSSESGGSILKYTEEAPDSWANATDYWVGGYLENDYCYMRNSVNVVDSENNQIELTSGCSIGKQSGLVYSKRYKVYNLLEELDTEGEYYIDAAEKKLYIYKSTGIENATIEVAGSNKAMISLNGAENITFEGINFSQTRGSAIEYVCVDNIDIRNCTFKDIGGYGVYNYDYNLHMGANKAVTDKDYWQVQANDFSYNCDITGCDFENIGSSAIYMYGGNVDTLTRSGNVISDNKITKAAQLAKYSAAIRLEGCGNTVSNNKISDCPNFAVYHMGNDHTITKNEIHNVIFETDDCAAIYCGRNTLQRGTVISYNYIYDLKASASVTRKFNGALYWDDRQTGITAKNNIIKNANIAVIVNGGVDNQFTDNVLIDISNNCTDTQDRGAICVIDGGVSVNNDDGASTTQNMFGSNIANSQIYYTAYPHLEELIAGECYNNSELSKYNIFTGNKLLNCDPPTYDSVNTEKATIQNNNSIDSFDIVGYVSEHGIGLITNR